MVTNTIVLQFYNGQHPLCGLATVTSTLISPVRGLVVTSMTLKKLDSS